MEKIAIVHIEKDNFGHRKEIGHTKNMYILYFHVYKIPVKSKHDNIIIHFSDY